MRRRPGGAGRPGHRRRRGETPRAPTWPPSYAKAAALALAAPLGAELDGTPIIVNAVDPDLTVTWLGAEAMGTRPVAASVPGIV